MQGWGTWLQSYTGLRGEGASNSLPRKDVYAEGVAEITCHNESRLPHGTCPLVGLGGHALYGGFGLSSRMWGLTLDNITSVSSVLAGGNTFSASETQNRDLFWALRGAGPSFAIVTEMTLQTYPVPESVIVWEYIWLFPLVPGAEAATKAFLRAQEFAAGDGAVRELGFGLRLEKGGLFRLYGVFYGSKGEFEETLESLVFDIDKLWGQTIRGTGESVGGRPVKKVREMDYMEALQALGEGINLKNKIIAPTTELLQAVEPVNRSIGAHIEALGPGVNDCFVSFASGYSPPSCVECKAPWVLMGQ